MSNNIQVRNLDFSISIYVLFSLLELAWDSFEEIKRIFHSCVLQLKSFDSLFASKFESGSGELVKLLRQVQIFFLSLKIFLNLLYTIMPVLGIPLNDRIY